MSNFISSEGNFLNLIQACMVTSELSVWQEFYQRYDGYINTYIKKALCQRTINNYYGIGCSQELISELKQDLYVKLLENDRQALRSFKAEEENSFLAYLSRICTNIVIEYFRKLGAIKRNAVRVSLETLFDEERFDSLTNDIFVNGRVNLINEEVFINRLMIKELLQVLKTSFNKGKQQRDRLVFILYSIYGLSPKQIAEQSELNVSYANVEAIIRRVRRQLITTWEAAPTTVSENRWVA